MASESKSEDKYELIYWGGNFAGRGEFVRLMLDLCGVEWVDAARVAGSSAPVMPYYKGESSTPCLFPPYLKHGDVVISQTTAIIVYLGQLHGKSPTDPVAFAQALQLSLSVMDALAEAQDAFHPTDPRGSYADQAEAAAVTVKAFCEGRLMKFLGYMEKVLAANKGGAGYFFGDDITFADVAVFSFMRGWCTSCPDHFKACEATPLLKGFTARMYALPKVKAFLASDRCTKMEAEDASPTAKAPAAQVNSFM